MHRARHGQELALSVQREPCPMTPYLDPRQLQNFVAVVREGGYTKAARAVNLSQSAISHSVRALETELNCVLIEKAGRKLVLTETGETFVREAEAVLESLSRLRARVDEMGKWGRGRLRIGAGSTACQFFLPPVLRELQAIFPRCELTVQPGNTPQSIELLAAGKLDVAILVRSPRGMGEVAFQRLFTDELRLVYAPAHEWARLRTLRPEDFAQETILQYSHGSATQELTAAYFEQQGIRVKRSLELGSMEALREMARIGQGVALLPDWLLRDGGAQGTLSRPVPGRPLRREWGMAHLRGKPLNLLEETLYGLCAEQARVFTGQNRRRFLLPAAARE